MNVDNVKEKETQREIKEKVLSDYEEKRKTEKAQCSECQKWAKEVDEENGICKKCVSKYESSY